MQYLLFLLALLISSASYSNDQIKNDEPFKWQGSENANETIFNEDYDNPKITCTDKDGNVYSRDKSIYKTCDELFEKISNNNDLYLSIDAILGEWEGTGSYDDNEYPVYVVFGLNSRGELIGRYNYGTKNNHEKGGNLSLLKDDRKKKWKEILELQRRFAMEWKEGNDNGWFTFQVNGDERILGFWGNDMKTRRDYGGSYSISKISNNVPKLENGENSNTIEPISRPNF